MRIDDFAPRFLPEELKTKTSRYDFIRDFLPFTKKELGLSQLPKIKVVDRVPDAEGTTFGCYRPELGTIYLVAVDRHPKDVMRTLAHELVHYKQDQENRLHAKSGATGSREENEANAHAGIIMRNYSQENPESVTESVASLNKLHNKAEYKKALKGFALLHMDDDEGRQHLDHYINTVDSLIQKGGTVYRAVWVLPGTKPNLKEPGQHWTISPESAEEYLDSNAGWGAYGDLANNGQKGKPVAYIISATVGPNSITNKNVLIAEFPEELEVSLVNPSSAKIKIVKRI